MATYEDSLGTWVKNNLGLDVGIVPVAKQIADVQSYVRDLREYGPEGVDMDAGIYVLYTNGGRWSCVCGDIDASGHKLSARGVRAIIWGDGYGWRLANPDLIRFEDMADGSIYTVDQLSDISADEPEPYSCPLVAFFND